MTQQLEDIAQAKINRAQAARRLLDDPVLNEAFDALVADADQVVDQSKPHEVDLREDCYRAKQAIKALRKKLAGWISDGTLEQMRIDELNAKEKRNAPN
jgi:hypothetical protein